MPQHQHSAELVDPADSDLVWRVIRNTVDVLGRYFEAGALFRGARPRLRNGHFNIDFEPANDAARASVPKSLLIREPEEKDPVPPFPGMVRGERNKDGSYVWRYRRGDTVEPVEMNPMWRFVGQTSMVIGGIVRHPGAEFYFAHYLPPHELETLVPMNDPAREVLGL